MAALVTRTIITFNHFKYNLLSFKTTTYFKLPCFFKNYFSKALNNLHWIVFIDNGITTFKEDN
jgi:hypothetical protein